MRRLIVLAALSAAFMTSACITVIDAGHDDDFGWHGQNAQPFDSARDACRAETGKGGRSEEFRRCMADKGWTRS